MDALIVCECRHTIVAHENGRCSNPGCTCTLGSFTVLDEAIDRIKTEHAMKHAGSARPATQALSRS
ncbi:MAG: hypothetical protein NVS3B16_08880 [Vulcanimicrobiaceae bacterium]